MGCIENVISQQCDNLEHIFVDGGSTDGSVEILEDYASRYPHIRWLSEKDSGQSDALNKGIEMARGSILGILNVDDFYQPGVVTRVLALFQDTADPSLIVGNCYLLNEKNEVCYIARPIWLTQVDLLVGGAVPFPNNPAAYFYHKSIHDRVGLYDVDDHFSMDLDFLLRAVAVSRNLYFDEHWGNFRFLPGCKTFEDMKEGRAEPRVRELRARYLKGLPLTQRLLVRLLRIGPIASLYYGPRLKYRGPS